MLNGARKNEKTKLKEKKGTNGVTLKKKPKMNRKSEEE
jgi:hypothetical protein